MEKIKVSLNKYSLPQIRYAAYVFTKDFYAEIKKNKDLCEIMFSPKNSGKKVSVKRKFLTELEDEKFRSELFDANRELREYLIKSALVYKPADTVKEPDGLTEEEEKELDKIIAEVEAELKKEKEDPLEIKKTWEEKYGGKNKRK
ncbi:MAG: hypothetical protein GX447_02460 [Elusimicrobia bacterium]|nr:hypothetical protein [Elusimicrobiota bacterium]